MPVVSTQPTSRRRRFGRLAAVLAVASLSASATVTISDQPVAAAPADTRPNIILITTDDMARTDLRWMPQTRKLLGTAGVSLPQFISNHPVCCPARAEILTGQYAQNNGVRNNVGPLGGYDALREEGQHIGSWLKDAGYRTAFVGKHLNGWENNPRTQPGWTRFNPIVDGIYRPFDLTMWRDGQPLAYSGTHTSDLMGRLTNNYIRNFAQAGGPFFIWTSQVAPHGMQVDGRWVPPLPAARHRGVYPDALPPTLKRPSYGEADVSDKPQYVQDSVTLSRTRAIAVHRARIRSLRSVDDQVKSMVDTLRKVGRLRNTFIFFTSDNGYLLGEHRLRNKNYPYEESLRVPFLARGPGIPAGTTRDGMYSLVDLAPTFLRIAGVSSPRVLDGRSMLPTLRRGAPGYSDYLIQAGHEQSDWWWRGVRSKEFVYVKYYDPLDGGFEELYDMRKDPYQLRNVAQDPLYAAELARYRLRLETLGSCAGSTCWTPAPSEP